MQNQEESMDISELLSEDEPTGTPEETGKAGRKRQFRPKRNDEPETRTSRIYLTALTLWLSYFLVEVFAGVLLQPESNLVYAFAACWGLIFTTVTMCLPRLGGRIFYGLSYFIFAVWAIAQTGYDQLFNKIMWLADIRYADEGMGYADVLLTFPLFWWIGSVLLLVIGVVLIRLLPRTTGRKRPYLAGIISVTASVIALIFLPNAIFALDDGVWGTHSEYGQSSSAKASYTVMYDNRRVYDLCGLYHFTFRDLWKHEIYPMTPAYRQEQAQRVKALDRYFDDRGYKGENEMTGIFAGKNVILVLMESMDDWLVTQDDTPTLCKLMDEGINFTNFYTPGFGSVRTFNTEFCVNTGIYLPTTGQYVFDYVTNNFNESMPNALAAAGYDPLCFHYNSPSFYSRGVFEPTMGYGEYITYEDYTDEEDDLYSDVYLWDNLELRELFFREGQTFNFVITRSAHLSYTYREVLSHYALKQYPEYRGRFGHEEIDCARVKAKLVDDMFARLLEELEAEGELENTVIVGVTDHYTYGFDDTQTLFELSGVDDELLLEKTPCFIWSYGGPDVDVDKALNTADLLPTVMNLMGLQQDTDYLGQDAFDPDYVGYVIFPNGSWVCDGVVCKMVENQPVIILNEKNKTIIEEELQNMDDIAQAFIGYSNMLLSSDYYAK